MGHMPFFIDAVARKPSSNVVVDAASLHAIEASHALRLGLWVRGNPQKIHLAGQGELGAAEGSAMEHVPGGAPCVELVVKRLVHLLLLQFVVIACGPRSLRRGAFIFHGGHSGGQVVGVGFDLLWL